MKEFSSPEVEAAYWDAVERVAEEVEAPADVRAKRREALLKWLPSPAEGGLANDKLGKELFSRERNTMSTPIYDGLENPVTTDGEGNPTPKPTAKVAAGAIAGIALTVIVAVLGAIDVNLLGFLGGWAPVALVGIGALASSLTAYIKKPTGEIS